MILACSGFVMTEAQFLCPTAGKSGVYKNVLKNRDGTPLNVVYTGTFASFHSYLVQRLISFPFFCYCQVFQGGNWLHLHELLSLSSGDQVLL